MLLVAIKLDFTTEEVFKLIFRLLKSAADHPVFCLTRKLHCTYIAIQGSYSCVIVDSWTLVAGLATAISAVVNPILDHRWEIISTGRGRHSCGADTWEDLTCNTSKKIFISYTLTQIEGQKASCSLVQFIAAQRTNPFKVFCICKCNSRDFVLDLSRHKWTYHMLLPRFGVVALPEPLMRPSTGVSAWKIIKWLISDRAAVQLRCRR